MKKMMVLSLMLVALMALFIPTTSAQDSTLCYNLPQADCDYINAAAANTALATSFVQKFSLNFEITGLESLAMFAPGTPASVSLQVSGEGPFVIDSTDTFPANLSLPMSVVIDGTPAEVRFDVVDSVVYFGTGDQIVGFPIADLLAQVGMGDMDATAMMGSTDMLGSVGDMLPVNDFITYTREADVDWNGMSVSPFVLTADISGMLQSPEVGMLLGMVGPMLGGGAEADPTTTMLLTALPQIMGGLDLKFDVSQYVGTDNYIHKLTVNFDGAVDLNAIMGALSGGAGGDMGLGTINIVVDFDVELTQINETLTVTAPEGARILTPEEAQQFFDALAPLMGALGQ